MNNLHSNFCYDHDGKPCDFEDEKGLAWIYVGKRNGIDEWEGAPNDDEIMKEADKDYIS